MADACSSTVFSLLTAATLAFGCSSCAHEKALTKENESLKRELEQTRQTNANLTRRVEELSERLADDAVRGGRQAESGALASASPSSSTDALVPPHLRVVKVTPQTSQTRSGRVPPAVPTQIPLVEPQPGALESLEKPRGGHIASQAAEELVIARERSGAESARALDRFALRYPRHPEADNALLDAARIYTRLGDADAACALLKRSVEEYPASDSLPDALLLLAECQQQRGQTDRAAELYRRVIADFPNSTSAQRAEKGLQAVKGATP